MIEGSGATTILDASISSNLEIVINDAIEVRDGDRQITTMEPTSLSLVAIVRRTPASMATPVRPTACLLMQVPGRCPWRCWLWRRQWCRITSLNVTISGAASAKLNKRICLCALNSMVQLRWRPHQARWSCLLRHQFSVND